MISGLDKSKTRRVWIVPDFQVWGMKGLGNAEYLALETVGTEKNIHFGSVAIAGLQQQVLYSNLKDRRDNSLPSQIASPMIVIQPRSEYSAFIVGESGDTSFIIARAPGASGPVRVDLMIMEMGT